MREQKKETTVVKARREEEVEEGVEEAERDSLKMTKEVSAVLLQSSKT